MKRRRALAGALALGWRAACGTGLDEAEAALARGDLAAAQQGFESAAAAAHEPQIELGLVRSALQAGRFQQALALAAHAGGAHLESTGAMALYVWLLNLCGQRALARRQLDEALRRAPSDPLLRAADAAPLSPVPALLRVTPHRAAPYASGARVPAQARVIATAARIGSQALAPAAALGGAASLWLRDGLGRTCEAARMGSDNDGIAVLALRAPPPAVIDIASRDPFPGSPCHAFAHAPDDSGEAAWPWLFAGFAGRVAAQDGARSIGFALPPAADGAVLLDADGRAAGLALRDGAGGHRFESLARWRAEATAPPVAPRPNALAVYEQALPAVLQVLAG